MKKLIILSFMTLLVLSNNVRGQQWLLTGNTGTTPGTNYIGTTDNKDIIFKTSSSTVERMHILGTSGFIGIGTPTPLYRLHIDNGGVTIGNLTDATSRANNVLRFGDGDYVKIGEWENNNYLSFVASRFNFNNGSMWINNGNIYAANGGIIQSSAASGLIRLFWSETFKNSYLDFDGNLNLRTDNNANISPLILEQTGNVGIGYPTNYTPGAIYTQGYKLGVNGSVLCESLKVNTIISAAKIGIGTTNPLTDLQVNGSVSIGYESVLPSLSKSVIVSGNVGIGTFAPTTKLEVIGKTKTDSLQVTKGFNTGYVLVSDYRGNAIWTDPTTVNSGAWIRNGNNIYVATDKKIGIGTVTPVEPLHVLGNALITGSIKGGHTDSQSLALFGNSNETDGAYMYIGNNGTGSDGSIKMFAKGINSTIEFSNKNNTMMIIKANNDIVFGRPDAKSNMYVNGDISANLVRVNTNTWYDCVFEKDYKLQPLSDVEKYIKQNKHLPEIPSDAEVKANGIDVAQINALLLKKVEELTLYVIELEKRVNEIKK